MKNAAIVYLSIISILFTAYSPKVYAADFSFSDNFSGDYNIDKNLSSYKFTSGAIAAPDNIISARTVSVLLINTIYNIGSAKLEVAESFPAGGRIVYYVSNDNGNTWTETQKNVFANFSSFGKRARWSAVMARANSAAASPEIHSIKITVRESDLSVLTSGFNNSLATRGLGSSLFDPNSYALDDELNNLIGRNVFARIDFLKTTSNVGTNSENNINVAESNAGNNARVAGASIAKVAGISTGTTGSLALSLLLSTLATFIYVAYAQNGLFRERQALATIQRHRSDKNRFNFAS